MLPSGLIWSLDRPHDETVRVVVNGGEDLMMVARGSDRQAERAAGNTRVIDWQLCGECAHRRSAPRRLVLEDEIEGRRWCIREDGIAVGHEQMAVGRQG